jgi:peptide/nickel transport system substrate-binding protein
MYLLGWGVPTLDSHYVFTFMYQTNDAAKKVGGWNYTGYSNPKMDELLDAARSEGDQAKRKALYAQVTRLAAEDAPYIWIHHDAEVKVWGEHLKGFEHISDGMIRVKGVWLEKK